LAGFHITFEYISSEIASLFSTAANLGRINKVASRERKADEDGVTVILAI